MKETLHHRDFYTLASRVFKFLVVDFGFSRPKRDTQGREHFLIFSKSDSSVLILYEGGCPPNVLLRWNNKTNGDRAGIEALTDFGIHINYPRFLMDRYRDTKSMHSLVYMSWMAMQADYLLHYGRRFLNGDFMFLQAVMDKIRKFPK